MDRNDEIDDEYPYITQEVAPLTGSVDRNCAVWADPAAAAVAPLTGSVDRNLKIGRVQAGQSVVAPLTGSVDRNPCLWEEANPTAVAPLTGSVDRNIPASVFEPVTI